jgi:hypothetical protein
MKAMAISTWLNAEPSHPQEIHPFLRSPLDTWMGRRYNRVEYSDYARVPVRLCAWSCFWGLDHHIQVCIWLYGVAVPSDIICRIVDPQRLATEDFFAGYKDGFPLFIRELSIGITFVSTTKKTT